jgi:hypothetical protein
MVSLPGEQPVFNKTTKQKPRNTKHEKIAPRNKPSGKTLIAHSLRPGGTTPRSPRYIRGEAGYGYDNAAQAAITRVSAMGKLRRNYVPTGRPDVLLLELLASVGFAQKFQPSPQITLIALIYKEQEKFNRIILNLQIRAIDIHPW